MDIKTRKRLMKQEQNISRKYNSILLHKYMWSWNQSYKSKSIFLWAGAIKTIIYDYISTNNYIKMHLPDKEEKLQEKITKK